MDRKAFRQLLTRYLDNSSTDEERDIVDQWYKLLDNKYQELSDWEIKDIEDRLWNKIESTTITAVSAGPLKAKKSIWWKYAAAASVVGAVLLSSAIVFQKKRTTTSTESLVVAKVNDGYLEEINNSSTAKKVKLEDGSTITIYPGSSLAFPKHFVKERREVFLEGEAFFDISRDPNRPFFVFSKQIVTQVLGTSFDIRSKKGQVEVAVKTGKVTVYENKEQIRVSDVQQKSNGVIITPNQKVTYYQEERHFITSLVDQPIPVLKESEQKNSPPDFNYSETTLGKVLEDLENTYQLEIVVENERIKNCLFTGDLTDENLFNQLQSICLAFSADYEVKGTKILLKGGKDCTVN